MTNYMGKSRLIKILYQYLKDTSSDKLMKLEEERKEWRKQNHDIIYYRKYRGSEWLEVSISFDDTSYSFILYSCANNEGQRRLELTEKRNRWNEKTQDDENSQIFYGNAFYDAQFNPSGGNAELKCFEIRKGQII
ncbi:hypothetical protein Osc1_11900 [Hominimerdicola sp. 21CYCFAH17_S]